MNNNSKVHVPIAQIEESFRTLRTNLILQARADWKVFLITSARPREGKSTIAAILGKYLAATGRSILVVDGDCRRPRLHEIFQVPNKIGWSDVLDSKNLELRTAVQEVKPGLHFLSSGTQTGDPQRYLMGDALQHRLAEFRKSYDLILIDSPPLLAVADGVLLAPQADGVIMVVRAGEATASEIRLARERLTSVSAKLVGCVLNGAAATLGLEYHPYGRAYLEHHSLDAVSRSKPAGGQYEP